MSKKSRAEINQANAQHSTGPKTAEGKRRSSQNSFNHGMYSAVTVAKSEPMADFEALRADFLAEYEPATATERALVEDLVQNHWRVLRFRRHERHIFETHTNAYQETGMMATLLRVMTSAERAFHRTLKELKAIQKERAQAEAQSEPSFVRQNDASSSNGFVSQNEAASNNGFVPQKSEPIPASLAQPNVQPKPQTALDLPIPAAAYVNGKLTRGEAHYQETLRKEARKASKAA